MWFTSDQHFFHHNVLEYCKRPFKSAHEMNETIIANYNALVSPSDTVYMLGDLGILNSSALPKLESVIQRLNGNKHLILGNHDMYKPFTYVRMGFVSVHTSLEVEGFYLAHEPAVHKSGPVLCGHVHEKWLRQANVVNVGVDVWDFKPVHLAELV